MSVDIFRVKNEDGSDGNWAYFSESKGDIVNVGTDEQEAKRLAELDGPKTTIATALAGDTSAPPPQEEKTPVDVGGNGDNASSVDVVSDAEDSRPSVLLDTRSEISAPVVAKPEEPAKPARPPLSPVFIKKLVAQLGSNTTNMTIEFERFMIARFGYTTEELAEDDDDVEIVRMGWDAIWQSYLQGKDPPLWMILAFGYSCVTVRLIANAKKTEKKGDKDVIETTTNV